MNETRTLTIELLPSEARQLLKQFPTRLPGVMIDQQPTRAMEVLRTALDQISRNEDVRVPDELGY